jgi:hypothetical protein
MFDMFTSRNVKKNLKISIYVWPNTLNAPTMSDQILGVRGCWLSNLSDISLEWVRHFGRDMSDLRVWALIHLECTVAADLFIFTLLCMFVDLSWFFKVYDLKMKYKWIVSYYLFFSFNLFWFPVKVVSIDLILCCISGSDLQIVYNYSVDLILCCISGSDLQTV